jgi:hypothetical protein
LEDTALLTACTNRYFDAVENVSELLADFIDHNPQDFLY